MAEQRVEFVSAIAVAYSTSAPSNTEVLWVDLSIQGDNVYEKLKCYINGNWTLINRNASQILKDLKTVDGIGSGLDADTLQGLTPDQLIQQLGGVPLLSSGELLVGQADSIGVAKTISGIATIDTNGVLTLVPGSISHTELTDIGVNTHAQIDSHISDTSNPHNVTAAQVGNDIAQWNAGKINGNVTNVGAPGAGQDGYAIVWDAGVGEFVLQAVTADSIYTTSGTVPSSVVATITDTLTFSGGNLIKKGSDTLGTTSGFKLIDSASADLWDFRNNGDVYQGKDSTIYLSANDLTLTNTGDVTIENSNGSFAFQSNGATILNRVTSGTGTLVLQSNGVNFFKAGAFTDYWSSAVINIGSVDGDNGFKIENDRIRYFTTVGSAGVIHDIHADRFALFGQGFSTPANSYFSIGSFTRIGSEKISLQDNTYIESLGVGAVSNASAILDVTSTTKGSRPFPQVTTAQMNAISTPATNLVVYNTDLSSLMRYDGASWVSMASGYGLVSVNDSSGIPTFYADLQDALETCKTSGGVFTVQLHSNITTTGTISIKSNGSGVGSAYAFDMLTIDLNGYEIKNDNADSTYCFDLLLSDNININRTLLFKNGKITRTSGTGTHYAIYSTTTGSYGTLLFDKCIVYGENSYGAYIGIQQSTDRLYDINDFGGSLFISDSSYGLFVRNYNCKNFSVLGKSATSSAYLRNSITQNYSVENTSTGIGLTMVGNISSSNFRVKSTTGKGLYCADDVSGVISNFEVETTTGDGIETTGTNATYKPVFNNFSVICADGVCIDSNHTNTEFNNFYLRNNGTSKTISEVNSGTRQYTNGNAINLGSGQAFEVTDVTAVKFTNVKFISTSECVGSIYLNSSVNSVDFELCSFECNYDDATGNCIEISNSTGLIDVSLSKFKVKNASANALYATASRTLNFTNNYVKGATTPINANVTVNASTDLGDGNRSY